MRLWTLVLIFVCYMLIVGGAVSGCLAFDRWIMGHDAAPASPPATTQPTTQSGAPPAPPPPRTPPPAAGADEAIGNTMTIVGTILGIPFLSGAGYLWGRGKPLRALRNVVRYLQCGRKHLHDNISHGIAAEFDSVLRSAQKGDPATEAVVRSIKKKLKIASVTHKAVTDKAVNDGTATEA